MKRKGLLYCVFWMFVLSSSSLFAQSVSKMSPVQALNDLENGVLVVRIGTSRNKINKLRELVARPGISEKEKNRFSILLDETILHQQVNQKSIMEGFAKHYAFSEVRFIPDTLIKQLDQPSPSGIFINPVTNELDASISIDTNQPYFILRAGDSRLANNSYFITGIIMDDEFNDINSRYFVAKMRIKYLYPSLFWDLRRLIELRGDAVPQELNRVLYRFQLKLNSSEG